MSSRLEIYAITSRQAVPNGDSAAAARAALRAGADWVQIREKDLSAQHLHALARRVVRGGRGDRVLVNDRVDVALAAGCGGVHLTGQSVSPRDVRRIAPHLRIGVSTHDLDAARRAEDEGADFVVFGPVFPTPSKARYGPPKGVAATLRVMRALTIPVFALGGIRWSNVDHLLCEGIHRIAAISMIVGARDAGGAVRRLRARHPVH